MWIKYLDSNGSLTIATVYSVKVMLDGNTFKLVNQNNDKMKSYLDGNDAAKLLNEILEAIKRDQKTFDLTK